MRHGVTDVCGWVVVVVVVMVVCVGGRDLARLMFNSFFLCVLMCVCARLPCHARSPCCGIPGAQARTSPPLPRPFTHLPQRWRAPCISLGFAVLAATVNDARRRPSHLAVRVRASLSLCVGVRASITAQPSRAFWCCSAVKRWTSLSLPSFLFVFTRALLTEKSGGGGGVRRRWCFFHTHAHTSVSASANAGARRGARCEHRELCFVVFFSFSVFLALPPVPAFAIIGDTSSLRFLPVIPLACLSIPSSLFTKCP